VFITGAPASGKSTIARKLAEHFPKSLHIQVDQLREMMVSGVEMPDHDWTDEASRQFQWARSTAIYMAKLYAGEGIDVVIDDVCVPANFPDYYTTLFDDPAVHRILLMPTPAALTARLERRAGPYDKFLADFIPWFYNYLEPMPKDGWIVLDTSDWPIEKTLDEVFARIGVVRDQASQRSQTKADLA
jgi:predicted kinase